MAFVPVLNEYKQRHGQAQLKGFVDDMAGTLGAMLLLVTLLGVSWRLTPDPAGMGTHHQLGLPMCSVRQFVGIRCPSCGMTTSWAHMVRGQVFSSVKANSGGALLAIVAIFTGPWMLLCGLRGRWLFRPPNEWAVLGVGMSVVFITVVDWIIRLNLGM